MDVQPRPQSSPQYFRLGTLAVVCAVGMFLARSATTGRGALWWTVTVAVLIAGAVPGWLAGGRYGRPQAKMSTPSTALSWAAVILGVGSFVLFGHRLNDYQVVWFCSAYLVAMPTAILVSFKVHQPVHRG